LDGDFRIWCIRPIRCHPKKKNKPTTCCNNKRCCGSQVSPVYLIIISFLFLFFFFGAPPPCPPPLTRTHAGKARKRNAWLANQQKQSSFRRHFFRVSYHAPLFFLLLFSTLRARAARERERERREESVRALQQDTAATREERKETTKEGMVCFLFAISGHDHFLQGMESQRRESVQRPSSSY